MKKCVTVLSGGSGRNGTVAAALYHLFHSHARMYDVRLHMLLKLSAASVD